MSESFYNEEKCNALLNIFRTIDENKVVCIDGGWGSGKSYFCNRLAEMAGDNFLVLSVDAFENDFNNDPLIILLSEISKLTVGEDRKRYLESISEHAEPFLESAGSFLGDAIPVPFSSSIGRCIGGVAGRKISNYLKLEKSIAVIKEELQKVVKINAPKKVIIIIDELDRCRPSFSLEIIEKVKHVFNVNGLHFVLSMNKGQMLSSIEHAYGISSDKESYLEKFIDFTIRLEKTNVSLREGEEISAEVDYALKLVDKNFSDMCSDNLIKHIRNFVALLVSKNSLEFRSVDRFVDKCFTYYLAAGLRPEEGTEGSFACFLCACTFVSIYDPSSLLIGKFGYVNERFSKMLLIDKKIYKLDDPHTQYDDKVKDKDKAWGGERFFGYIAAVGNHNAGNLAGSKYKSFVDVLPDQAYVFKHFQEWVNYVKK